DKGWDARKRAYCLKIQPATGSFARNLIYSTKPPCVYRIEEGEAGYFFFIGKKFIVYLFTIFVITIQSDI
ncbi:hypothetical protein ACB364_18255, partial [Enterobacter hormaechei]